MEAEVKVRGKVEAITEDKAEANQLKKKVEAALAEPPASEAKEGAPPRQEAFIVLTPEQGAQELAGILVEFLARYTHNYNVMCAHYWPLSQAPLL